MIFEKKYHETVGDIMSFGYDIPNERTSVVCRTLPNIVFTYDSLPMLSRKQVFFKSAVAEMVGYLRGYTNASQFRAISCKTWDANANETPAWLANPNRKGIDDMGRVYGAVGRDFYGYDLLTKIYNNLKRGIDDRGEILTWWDPSGFDLGCLRPCMHTHNFVKIGDVLHVTSLQRSGDIPLGIPFNAVQVWFLLSLMAHITGHKVGSATHVISNAHIYENQFSSMYEYLDREPHPDNNPMLVFDPRCVDLDYVLDESNKIDDIVKVVGYNHMGKIEIPFTV